MKKIKLLIIFFSLFIITTIYAKPETFQKHFIDYNKEYNDFVYLYRTMWSYLEFNALDKAIVYTEKETFHIDFANTGVYRDYFFRKIFYYTTDSTMYKTIKISLININGEKYNISINNNNIKYHNDNRLNVFAIKHLNYLYNINDIKHEQYNKNMSDRIRDVGINFDGTFAENISRRRSYILPKTKTQRIQEAIRSYFVYRNKTLHWKNLIDIEYNYYTTYFLQEKGVLYSLTVMTTDELY